MSDRPCPDQSHDVDFAVIVGTLSSDAASRDLPSGTRLCTLEVTARQAEGPARSVPVAQIDPPRRVEKLVKGDRVVVVGQVVRRFFRAGGSTASRTEVVASWVRRDTATARAAAAAWGGAHIAGMSPE